MDKRGKGREGGERERERARKRAEACAGGARRKKKSMETSCSIGEVSPRLSHAQVCNLRGFFGKKPHALFDTAPRRLVRARYTGCPGALALPTSREAGIFARKLVTARRENITSVGSSKDQLTFFSEYGSCPVSPSRVFICCFDFSISISSISDVIEMLDVLEIEFEKLSMLGSFKIYSTLFFYLLEQKISHNLLFSLSVLICILFYGY